LPSHEFRKGKELHSLEMWLCTLAGALIGILAFWIDALVCSF
jgi:hypothetical protein